MTLPPATPDTKDWTWVLERPCPECGFDAAGTALAQVPQALRENAAGWAGVLTGPDVARRPAPRTWSPLEYACHVRDVHRVFGGRYEQMLRADDPLFADWDQDAAAAAGDYPGQPPADVARDLVAGAEQVAVRLESLTPDDVERPGRRSNGSRFTVTSLARYHLHDVVHHAWDVGTG
ncbi:DinB family protein [Angustibacter aerolatus]|uniref:DinB-like domain-containing protein n=1 Tax=Angustibacter aerolatus TaxID=1162965 RepID=A0ABQ6JE23_9ACTN|nr:DinB family protein [Angustibacter aerolatus]GMA85075.1 hypothetical protein GCM10025868_03250 [Angustibacter aerolatus]